VGPTWAHLTEACMGLRGSALAALGQAHKAPKAQPASPRGNPKGVFKEGRGGNLPPTLPSPSRLGIGGGAKLGRPAPHIRGGRGAASPSPPTQTLAANCCPPSLSLATARRRSPAAETLHHKHHAVVLPIQSISPPYLLDQGRRRHRCTARVQLSEAPPLAA